MTSGVWNSLTKRATIVLNNPFIKALLMENDVLALEIGNFGIS